MVRSPFGHARITNIDTAEATSAPGVRGVFTGADLRDLWAGPMPCAWPVTDDMKNPEHIPVAVDKVNFLGEIVAVVVGRLALRGPRRASRTVVVDYEPLRCGRRPRGRAQRPGGDPRRARHQQELHVGADSRRRRRRPGLRRCGAHRERALHPAAAHPRGDGAQGRRRRCPSPMAGEFTLYSATQIPHILKIMVGVTLRHPRAEGQGDRPGGRRRLRLQAQRLRRGADRRRRWPASSACRPGGPRTAPRTRWPRSRAAARSRTSSWPPTRTARSPRSGSSSRRHGGIPPARHARHPAARGVPVPRRLRHPELLVRVHVGVHQQDADRRVPGCRAARGHLRHRAGDRLAGPRRSASTRPRSGGATTSRPTSSRTSRRPG